jgi:hypothetical protein
MGSNDLCQECGAPFLIANEMLWLNSGVIVQGINMSWRIVFAETLTLDPLFSIIADLIGESIDSRAVEIGRKSSIFYFENTIRPEVRSMLQGRLVEMDVVGEVMRGAEHRNGFGEYEVVELHTEEGGEEWIIMNITDPFSIPLALGTLVGSLEVVTGNPQTASLKAQADGAYQIVARANEGRTIDRDFDARSYHHRDGDIYLERCGSCGVPKGLSNFKWHMNRGRIEDERNGSRIVCLGADTWDPLFKELENELGNRIPATIIEAQRLLVRKNCHSFEMADEDQLRGEFALRGMGNLREMKSNPKGAYYRIDDSVNHLVLIGTCQALFELAFGVESEIEWDVSARGDLHLEILPRKPG